MESFAIVLCCQVSKAIQRACYLASYELPKATVCLLSCKLQWNVHGFVREFSSRLSVYVINEQKIPSSPPTNVSNKSVLTKQLPPRKVQKQKLSSSAECRVATSPLFTSNWTSKSALLGARRSSAALFSPFQYITVGFKIIKGIKYSTPIWTHYLCGLKGCVLWWLVAG